MATKLNLTIDQGSDFTLNFDLKDSAGNAFDLTGYTGRSQFRKYYTSNTSYTLGAVTGNTNGVVTLSLGAANSAAIPAGRYLYDVEIVSAGNTVTRILEGILTLTPEITR